MIQDEHIQTLTRFGLTLLQAKTYLALAMLGTAEVRAISKASDMARQDIYRIMPILQKLGLSQKILSKPIMYKATPIKEGLSILLQNRKEEYAELQKKTISLINNFHANNAKVALKEEGTQFVITSEITRFLKIHIKKTRKAQKSIDVMIPLVNAPSKIEKEWSQVKKSLKRGVKIRLIAQEPGENTPPTPWQDFVRNSFFELKSLAVPIRFGMHIFDKKEVTLSVSGEILPCLWSNSPTIVELAASYFDEMWCKA